MQLNKLTEAHPLADPSIPSPRDESNTAARARRANPPHQAPPRAPHHPRGRLPRGRRTHIRMHCRQGRANHRQVDETICLQILAEWFTYRTPETEALPLVTTARQGRSRDGQRSPGVTSRKLGIHTRTVSGTHLTRYRSAPGPGHDDLDAPRTGTGGPGPGPPWVRALTWARTHPRVRVGQVTQAAGTSHGAATPPCIAARSCRPERQKQDGRRTRLRYSQTDHAIGHLGNWAALTTTADTTPHDHAVQSPSPPRPGPPKNNGKWRPGPSGHRRAQCGCANDAVPVSHARDRDRLARDSIFGTVMYARTSECRGTHLVGRGGCHGTDGKRHMRGPEPSPATPSVSRR